MRGAGPGSPAALHQMNQAHVLGAVRRADLLRLGEIAELTGLSRPTVVAALDELCEAGWVCYADDGPPGRQRVGRPARVVRFRSEAGFVVGIDVGAHTTEVVIANLDGAPVATAHQSTAEAHDRTQLLSVIRATVHDALARSQISRNSVMSVAVGSPGIVNLDERTVVHAPSLPGWASINLAKELRSSFRAPVLVENDVNLAVLAECWRGAASPTKNVVFVLWGERVGAGIFIEGRLHRGHAGAAGELGYLSVLEPDGEAAADHDGLGPFERAVGSRAIVAMARAEASRRPTRTSRLAVTSPELDALEVFRAADAGDRAARRVVDAVIARFARGLAPLLLLLDPDMVVIGGRLAGAGDAMFDALRAGVHRLCLVNTQIERSLLGEDAVAIGAVRLALSDVEERLLPRVESTGPPRWAPTLEHRAEARA